MEDLSGQPVVVRLREEARQEQQASRPAEGKLYLCAIKDVFSGRIVGYSISDRMKARLAVNALNNAASPRAVTSPAASCIRTEDRSSGRRSSCTP